MELTLPLSLPLKEVNNSNQLDFSSPGMESGYNTGETTTTPDPTTSPSSSSWDQLNFFSIATELHRLLEDSQLVDTALILQHINLSIPPQQSFHTHKDAILMLNATEPATLKDLNRLAIVILGPTGASLPVLQRTSLNSTSALICTFRPLIPGSHIIIVYHDATELVRGSPLKLMFSRDYNTTTTSTRHILSWNNNQDVNHPDAATTTEDDNNVPRKAWGMTCNTTTEQIWIADREKHQLLVFGPDGTLDFIVGHQGYKIGEFYRPAGIVYDAASDRIFVSDKDNHRIQVLDARRGTILGAFGSRGSTPGKFLYPWGLAVSPDGSLIAVADSRNHRIQIFDPTGGFLSEFRVADPQRRNRREFKEKFDYPRGLAFNLKGDSLFVTDFNLDTVFQLNLNLDPHHRQPTTITYFPLIPAGTLRRPSGIVVDSAGNLIIADSRNNALQIFSSAGLHLKMILTLDGPQQDIDLKLPTDVCCLRAGFLAVLDAGGRITIF